MHVSWLRLNWKSVTGCSAGHVYFINPESLLLVIYLVIISNHKIPIDIAAQRDLSHGNAVATRLVFLTGLCLFRHIIPLDANYLFFVLLIPYYHPNGSTSDSCLPVCHFQPQRYHSHCRQLKFDLPIHYCCLRLLHCRQC